jgi:hypothetical protein
MSMPGEPVDRARGRGGVHAAPRDVEADVPAASLGSGSVPAPLPRRHRVVFWAAVVASLAAVAGGGYLAVTRYQEETAPERVVLDYLTALASGDAAGALAYGDLPEDDRDLLSDEVLAAQLAIAPISSIAVSPAVGSGETVTAEVRYELGFDSGPQTVEDTITLAKTGRTWRLAEVAVPVSMRVTYGASRATIAGAEVPDGRQLVFPGALPITFDTENLELDETTRVVRFSQDGDLEEQAELSAIGHEAVATALDAALASCLDGTAAALTLCPLPTDARSVPGSVRGTLVEPASETVLIETQSGNDGLVKISGQVTVSGEYQQLDFNNQHVAKSGDIVIFVRAACYATSPDVLIWRTT